MIDYVDFKKHAAGFNLLIRLKTGKEYVFQNIQSNEFDNLFGYIRLKGLRIMNIVEALINVAAGDEEGKQLLEREGVFAVDEMYYNDNIQRGKGITLVENKE